MASRIKSKTAPKKLTWRERYRALKYIPPFFKLVWATHRGFTVLMILLRAVRSFVPVATLWVGKLIIDAVLAARVSPDAANQPFYNN